MKKIYSLVAVLAATFAANAQTNLVTNGNLDNWTSNTMPADFSPAPYTANVTKDSITFQTAPYAAKHQAQTSATKIQTEVTGIIAGNSYTISYWYLDNDPNAKTRMWSFWLKEGTTEGSFATLPNNEAEFRAPDYSTDSPNWVQKTFTLTAPLETVGFRFEARTYTEGAGSGFIYYDTFSIIDNTATASIVENNIEGLKVYPNPASDLVNIVSNEIGTKTVAIYDMLGKKVLETSTEETVNVSTLTSGVYIMNITQDGKNASRKLVIK